MNPVVIPARSHSPEQLAHLEWCFVELELMAPLPEPDPWATTEIELVEEGE